MPSSNGIVFELCSTALNRFLKKTISNSPHFDRHLGRSSNRLEIRPEDLACLLHTSEYSTMAYRRKGESRKEEGKEEQEENVKGRGAGIPLQAE